MTQSLILAGGLGTRLKSVLADRPKPMAMVGDRPVLEHQVVALRDSGVEEVILATGYMAEAIETHFGDGSRLGIRIRYVREREPLGTAGAIRNAESLIGAGPLLVLNGDTLLTELDYADVVREHDGACATLVAVRPPDAGAYGGLRLDGSGSRIIEFREKAPLAMRTDAISGGVYVLDPRVLEFIPEGRPVSIETEVFPNLLNRGLVLRAYRYEGFFGDVGTPEGLARVRRQHAGVRQ